MSNMCHHGLDVHEASSTKVVASEKLCSSRKASKRLYDSATMIAIKGRGPDREKSRSALPSAILVVMGGCRSKELPACYVGARGRTPCRRRRTIFGICLLHVHALAYGPQLQTTLESIPLAA